MLAAQEESTLNLQALNEACPNAPWSLTFSYGRALQSTCLKVRVAFITGHFWHEGGAWHSQPQCLHLVK